jgi:cytochrome P450
MGLDWVTTSMHYGVPWRRTRKSFAEIMGAAAVPQYRPDQLLAARRLASTILQTEPAPDTLSALIRASFGETIVKLMYGIVRLPPKKSGTLLTDRRAGRRSA